MRELNFMEVLMFVYIRAAHCSNRITIGLFKLYR
jgi:hypothetical protein